MGDIIQIKKNDFALAQNELKITQAVIVDLIIGAKSMKGAFDPKSLAGPGLNDLGLFYSYIGSAYYYKIKSISKRQEYHLMKNLSRNGTFHRVNTTRMLLESKY